MSTITQDLYDEITNELGNLKTDEEKDQVIRKDSLFKL